MKKVIAILGLGICLNSVSYADSMLCQDKAMKIAQVVLDLKANAQGEKSGYILKENVTSTKKGQSATYSFGGNIYKGNFIIDVTVDSSCGVESVIITEDI